MPRLYRILLVLLVALSGSKGDQRLGDSNIVEVRVLPDPDFKPKGLSKSSNDSFEVEKTVMRTVTHVSEKLNFDVKKPNKTLVEDTKKKIEKLLSGKKLKNKVKTVQKKVTPSVLVMQRANFTTTSKPRGAPETVEVVEVEKISDKTKRKPSLYRIKKRRKLKVLKSKKSDDEGNWDGLIELKFTEDENPSNHSSSSSNSTDVIGLQENKVLNDGIIKKEKMIRKKQFKVKKRNFNLAAPSTTITMKFPETTTSKPLRENSRKRSNSKVRIKVFHNKKVPRKLELSLASTVKPDIDNDITSTLRPFTSYHKQPSKTRYFNNKGLSNKLPIDFTTTIKTINETTEEPEVDYLEILHKYVNEEPQNLPSQKPLKQNIKMEDAVETLPTPLPLRATGRSNRRRQRPKRRRKRPGNIPVLAVPKNAKKQPGFVGHEPILIKPLIDPEKNVEVEKIRLFYRTNESKGKRKLPKRKRATTMPPSIQWESTGLPYERKPATFSTVKHFTSVPELPEIFTTPKQPSIISNFHSPFLSPTLDFKINSTTSRPTFYQSTTERSTPSSHFKEVKDEITDDPEEPVDFKYSKSTPPSDDKWHPIIGVRRISQVPGALKDMAIDRDGGRISSKELESLLVADPYEYRVSKAINTEIMKVEREKDSQYVDEGYLIGPGPPYNIPTPIENVIIPTTSTKTSKPLIEAPLNRFPSSKDIPGHSQIFETKKINSKPYLWPTTTSQATTTTARPTTFRVNQRLTPELFQHKVPKYSHQGKTNFPAKILNQINKGEIENERLELPIYTFSNSPTFEGFKVNNVGSENYLDINSRPKVMPKGKSGEIYGNSTPLTSGHYLPEFSNFEVKETIYHEKPIFESKSDRKKSTHIPRSLKFGPPIRDESMSVVDFGASTGEQGAFGWYSDHPVLGRQVS